MGCDIHVVVSVWKANYWENKYGKWVIHELPYPASYRDYDLFALLGGVCNDADELIDPIGENRFEDFDFESLDHAECPSKWFRWAARYCQQWEYHSPSYVTLAELRGIDWKEQSISSERKTHLKKLVKRLIELMETYQEFEKVASDEHVRLEFFFDN